MDISVFKFVLQTCKIRTCIVGLSILLPPPYFIKKMKPSSSVLISFFQAPRVPLTQQSSCLSLMPAVLAILS